MHYTVCLLVGAAGRGIASDGSNSEGPRPESPTPPPKPNSLPPLQVVSISNSQGGKPRPFGRPAAMRIFVLSGQSNMAGRGGMHHGRWDGVVPPECAPDPSILRLSAALEWEDAREPLHADIDTAKTCGVGPGMAFARAVLPSLQQQHDTPAGAGVVAGIGLVPCAVGGTALREWARGEHLYEQMVSRARAAAGHGEIQALLWYQGESDAEFDAEAAVYLENIQSLIANVRADLGMPHLPFVQVALASGNKRNIEKARSAQLKG